jgi:hypothetical protein
MFANAGVSMATQVGHAALSGFAVPSTYATGFSLAPLGWFLAAVVGLALVIVAIKLDRTREQSASKRAPAPLFGSDEAASASQVVRPLPLPA